MDQELMAVKGYSTIPRAPEAELYHWIKFSFITSILHFFEEAGGLTSLNRLESAYSKPGECVYEVY